MRTTDELEKLIEALKDSKRGLPAQEKVIGTIQKQLDDIKSLTADNMRDFREILDRQGITLNDRVLKSFEVVMNHISYLESTQMTLVKAIAVMASSVESAIALDNIPQEMCGNA
jgi:hypothetical protein